MFNRVRITSGRHKGKTGRVVGFYGMTPHSDVQLADGRILKIANRHLAAPARASRRATR